MYLLATRIISLMAVAIGVAEAAKGASPHLVKDINSALTTQGSSPGNFCLLNGMVFFAAEDFSHGRELWKCDATGAGTTLVKDIDPTFLYSVNGSPVSANSSNPGEFIASGSSLFFIATDATNGTELWKSDGTAEGTVIVKDIRSGSGSSSPYSLTRVGNTIFFIADDGINGFELWTSDGTSGGTILVKDINPGTGRSYPELLTAVGNTLFFRVGSGTNGIELWKSDGTSTGTTMVKDVFPGNNYGDGPSYLVAMGSVLYFAAADHVSGWELWKSDGTLAGTVMVSDINPGSASSFPSSLRVAGSTLYFTARGDLIWGYGLWKSNGVPGGTVQVRRSEGIQSLTAVGSTLYFVQDDGVVGKELWKSDGTYLGTTLVKDITPGLGWSSPASLTEVGTNLYFVADDGARGLEIWKSNGTSAGTTMVSDINPGSGSGLAYLAPNGTGIAIPPEIKAVGSNVFAIADDGIHGKEPWKSDGTAAGTVMTRDIYTGTLNASPSSVAAMGGVNYFTVRSSLSLWRSDGTAAGTTRLFDNIPYEIASNGNALYFTTYFDRNSNTLWSSDGTPAGTIPITTLGTQSSGDGSIRIAGNTLYLVAKDQAHGEELWKSDGTPQGTMLVSDINPGNSDSRPNYLTAAGNMMFLTANNGVNGDELWKSDGTAEGTIMLKDIYPGITGSFPHQLIADGNTVYFAAYDGVNGQELWKSDGTSAGTVMIKDIRPGTLSSNPGYSGSGFFPFAAVDGTIYFAASDGINGTELWKTDGTTTGTLLVKDIFPGSSSSNPGFLTAVANTLYFYATDGSSGTELWKSDGTQAGTVLVKDINLGNGNSKPLYLMAAGNVLYFSANDSINGVELWKSDGSLAGTTLVADLTGDASSSAPSVLSLVGNQLFFTATTESYGSELWALELPVPSAVTSAVSNLSATSATLNGTVNPNGAMTTVQFEHGLTTGYGSTATVILMPNNGITVQAVSATITDLFPGTVYHYRLTATSEGTESGADLLFTTPLPLPDWRQIHFGTTSNSGDAANTNDFDNDGLQNLIEWACHLDPMTSSVQPTSAASDGVILEFTYTRSVAALNAGAIFSVEWSDNLAGNEWHDTSVTESILSDDGSVQQVKATLPTGANGRRFVRLKVTSPPWSNCNKKGQDRMALN